MGPGRGTRGIGQSLLPRGASLQREHPLGIRLRRNGGPPWAAVRARQRAHGFSVSLSASSTPPPLYSVRARSLPLIPSDPPSILLPSSSVSQKSDPGGIWQQAPSPSRFQLKAAHGKHKQERRNECGHFLLARVSCHHGLTVLSTKGHGPTAPSAAPSGLGLGRPPGMAHPLARHCALSLSLPSILNL